MTADNPQAFSHLVEPVKASRDSRLTPSVRAYDLRDGWRKISLTLKVRYAPPGRLRCTKDLKTLLPIPSNSAIIGLVSALGAL